MKFKVGDKVAVYGYCQDFNNGRIHELDGEQGIYNNDVMTPHMTTIRIHLDCGLQINAHPKQCRKLIKKRTQSRINHIDNALTIMKMIKEFNDSNK